MYNPKALKHAFCSILAPILSIVLLVAGCDGFSGTTLPARGDDDLRQLVAPGQLVTLDASETRHLSKNAVVHWIQTLGPAVELSDVENRRVTFTAPDVESGAELLSFELAVEDGADSWADEFRVVVDPAADASATNEAQWGGHTPVEFYCEPVEGLRDLIVSCSAVTVDGSALPAGEYTWTFDTATDAGPVTSHSTRSPTFTSAGLHTVKLTVLLAAMVSPIQCKEERTGEQDAKVAVWPTVSGYVRGPNRTGIAGVTVAADSGGRTAVTDADGFYEISVPYNWSGSITPRRAGRSMSPVSIALEDVVADQANQDFAARSGPVIEPTTSGPGGPTTAPGSQPTTLPGVDWKGLPIGIPEPSFGIRESTPSVPGSWNKTVVGFYYVDNTHPAATDSDNPNGYPGKPRASIPHDGPLPAGSVVEVHGGPYRAGSSGYIAINARGSAAKPVFIRGVGMPRFADKVSVYDEGRAPTSYLVIEGLDLFRCEILAPADHVALRRCNVQGDERSGGVALASHTAPHTVHDVTIYGNTIHDNGDWQASTDQDVHGITLNARVDHVWVLDNELTRNSGDGIQINAETLANQPTTHHIYVGRNVAWQNKQTGFWTKQAVDIVFSENVSHGHYPVGTSPSAWGAGMGYQYGPERVWFLYNEIYDCAFGIQAMATSGGGTGQASYFIGNRIHDIHHHPSYEYNPGSAWSNAAFMLMGTENRWIVNNTIYDVDAGINGPGDGMYYIANNIIDNVTDQRGNHIFIENSSAADASVILNNVFGGPARIRWGSGTVYNILGIQTAFGRSISGSVNVDPLLADPASGDLRLRSGSPAVDRGAATDVYQTFSRLYGLDILVDPDGVRRPKGAAIDAGAYELP